MFAWSKQLSHKRVVPDLILPPHDGQWSGRGTQRRRLLMHYGTDGAGTAFQAHLRQVLLLTPVRLVVLWLVVTLKAWAPLGVLVLLL